MAPSLTETTLAAPSDGDEMDGTLALASLEDAVQRNRYGNPERLEKKHPHLYRLIITMLAGGIEHTVIASAAGLDPRTILRVRERAEAQGICPSFHAAHLSQTKALILACGPALMARIEAGKVFALDLKLLHDIYQTLTGAATVIVGHAEDPDITSFREQWQQQLQSRKAVAIDSQVVALADTAHDMVTARIEGSDSPTPMWVNRMASGSKMDHTALDINQSAQLPTAPVIDLEPTE